MAGSCPRLCLLDPARLSAAEPGRLWSPVLFSLPSPAGFSGFAPPAERRMRLPLMTDFPGPLLEEQMERPPLKREVLTVPSVSGRTLWTAAECGAVATGTEAAARVRRVPVVAWMEGAERRQVEDMSLPADLPPPPSGRVVLYLMTDSRGVVLHVLPEEGEDYPQMSTLTATAYRWRFSPGEGRREVRVLIEWRPLAAR